MGTLSVTKRGPPPPPPHPRLAREIDLSPFSNEGSGQLIVDGSPAGNDGFLGADDNKGGDGADPQWVTIDSGCPQDVDGSGQVGIADLLAVLSAWGPCADCPEDINDDGTVGISDLLAVLSAWGPCP